MHEAARRHVESETRYPRYLRNPFELRAKVNVPAGALKLFPVTELSKYLRASVSSYFIVTSKSGQLYIEPPLCIKDTNEESWHPHVLFSGFWWVTFTNKLEMVTVQQTKCTVGEWTFPMFENAAELRAYTKLTALDTQPPKKKKAQ